MKMEKARGALINSFPGSFINELDEFIAHKRSNQYIVLAYCKTPEDIKCEVLEWFSRPSFKTEPYLQQWRNQKFHKFMLKGLNDFLDANISEEDIEIVYDKLGNSIDRGLTKEFLNHGMDIAWLKKEND